MHTIKATKKITALALGVALALVLLPGVALADPIDDLGSLTIHKRYVKTSRMRRS